MTEYVDQHCPPLANAARQPIMRGSLTALRDMNLQSNGHMILDEVEDWLGSATPKKIAGRWEPDGCDLGELGGAMAVSFSIAGAASDPERSDDTADDLIADEFFWLDCASSDLSMDAAASMYPWSAKTNYRHPIAGMDEVETLRCNTGAPWKQGGEIHVSFDGVGRPFCAELTVGFWLKAEVSGAIKWLENYLSRHGSRSDDAPYETITDGDEVRVGEMWWRGDEAFYEVFCTLGDGGDDKADPDAAPHYITVRKFLIPSGEPSTD